MKNNANALKCIIVFGLIILSISLYFIMENKSEENKYIPRLFPYRIKTYHRPYVSTKHGTTKLPMHIIDYDDDFFNTYLVNSK